MVAIAMDEPAVPRHLQAPLRDLAYAAAVCRTAAEALETADAADVVSALAGIHERDLAHLRRLGAGAGLAPAEADRDEVSAARGRLQLAQWREHDRAVLAIVRETEERVTRAYERMRDDPALPGEFRTLAGAALEELRRRHRRLDAAIRLAG